MVSSSSCATTLWLGVHFARERILDNRFLSARWYDQRGISLRLAICRTLGRIPHPAQLPIEDERTDTDVRSAKRFVEARRLLVVEAWLGIRPDHRIQIATANPD